MAFWWPISAARHPSWRGLFGKSVPEWVLMGLFFLAATGLTLFGMNLMRKGNAVIMVLMWVTFGTLVFFCAEHINPNTTSINGLALSSGHPSHPW